VGELMEQMTPEELQLWDGYLTRQHELQEEANRRAARRR
jgi:hypothetical protein